MNNVAKKPSGLHESIIFFCKDCSQICDVTRVPGRYVYTCDRCGTKNVAFGTVRSIAHFFHLKDEDLNPPAAEAAAEVEEAPAV